MPQMPSDAGWRDASAANRWGWMELTIEQSKGAAKAEGDRILAAAKAEIQQEVFRAKESLRNQVAELAVAGAAKILKREVDPKAHAALLAEIQKQL